MTALENCHCTYTNVPSDKQRNNHLTLPNVSISLLKKKTNNNKCYCAKIVITGDLNVGKTSLIRSLVGPENMSVLKGQRTGRVKTEFRKTDTNVKMDIWDTADNEVGKSSLISTFCYGLNDISKIKAATHHRKDITIDDIHIQMDIFDTAGQERYRSLTASYYRGAHGCLLLFDVTKAHTFDNVSSWFTDLKQYSIHPDNISTILVGMRCHAKKREISKEKAEAYAEHIGIPYMEVSAEEGTNVKEVFDLLADNILQVYQRHPSMCIEPTVSLNSNQHDIKAKQFLCSC